ncbi:MAG: HK97 family phage prohead protease [Cytophagaceae bacterium]|jgi:HK97 family phage prohead protease
MKKDYIKDIEGAERRFISPKMEVRASGDTKEIQGIAAVTNSWTDLGWYEEMIAPGAFDDVINDDVRALFNHDPNCILARSVNGEGTLKLSIDKSGNLIYSYKTPNRSYAKDLEDAINSGDVTQSSFAFQVREAKWEFCSSDNGLEKDRRTITKFEKLYDVSPVTYPAYQDTTVAARSKEKVNQEKPTSQSTDILRKKLNLKKKRSC